MGNQILACHIRNKHFEKIDICNFMSFLIKNEK